MIRLDGVLYPVDEELYLRGVITYLQEKRGLSLALLQSDVFRLEDVLKRKIAKSVEQAKASKGQLLYVMDVGNDELGRSVEGQIKAVLNG